MKVRLTAQDRVLDSLTGYVSGQVTEHLAQAMHDTNERVAHQVRVHEAMTTGTASADAHRLREWDELPQQAQERNRVQARRIGENLAAIGCFMVPRFDPALELALNDTEVRSLARLEYNRWTEEKIAARQADSPESRDDATPLPWGELPDAARVRHLQAARRLPIMVAPAGFQVLRGARSKHQRRSITRE